MYIKRYQLKVLIRLPDDRTKVLRFTAEIFFAIQTLNLLNDRSALRQKYLSGWVRDVTRKIHSDISLILP